LAKTLTAASSWSK